MTWCSNAAPVRGDAKAPGVAPIFVAVCLDVSGDRGTFRSDAATLIVSNGLGFTGQPVRLFTPREIGCLELRRA